MSAVQSLTIVVIDAHDSGDFMETILHKDAFDRWYKKQNDGLGQYVFERELFSAAITGEWLWIVPQHVMLGCIWQKNNTSTKIWVMVGEVPTDHITASAAATPRDAARHFAYKWQLTSARLEHAAGAGEKPEGQIDWRGMGKSVASSAEWLYELVENDTNWNEDGTPVQRFDVFAAGFEDAEGFTPESGPPR
jgi:hypothetical protein